MRATRVRGPVNEQDVRAMRNLSPRRRGTEVADSGELVAEQLAQAVLVEPAGE